MEEKMSVADEVWESVVEEYPYPGFVEESDLGEEPRLVEKPRVVEKPRLIEVISS